MQSCTVLMFPLTDRSALHSWGVPTPPRDTLPYLLVPLGKRWPGPPGKPNQCPELPLGILLLKVLFGLCRDPLGICLQLPMLLLLPPRRPPLPLSNVLSTLSR